MALEYSSLVILSAILAVSCSERNSLKIGMEYIHDGNQSPFSSTVYVFSDQGVSVYMEVGKSEDICVQKKDGAFLTSADSSNLRGVGAAKGTSLSRSDRDDNPLLVIFGPGDRMPVLESAPYKIQGASVYVDWSQGHSKYFAVSRCNSGSEVFTIKNEGLVLESATQPGFTLTMGGRAPSSLTFLEKLDAEAEHVAEQHRQESIEATREKERIKNEILGLEGK